MKHLLIRGLALSLGLLATSARGQETVWRSTAATPSSTTPVVTTGKPIAIAVSRPATPQPTSPQPAAPAAPVASLGRPMAIAVSETRVQPVSYTGVSGSNQPIVRGAAPDSLSRPLPTGDSITNPTMGQGTWRRADDVIGVSRTVRSESEGIASPAANVGSPNIGGSILPAPTLVPDSVGSSVVNNGPPITSIGQPIMTGAPQSSLFATNPADCGCNGGIKSGPVVDCPAGCGCGKAFMGKSGGASCGGASCGGPSGGSHSGGAWGRYVEPMFGGMGGDGGEMYNPALTINVEALLWWMKGDRTPPLASALGGGTATTIFGGQPLGDTGMVGTRATVNYWFNEEHCFGLEVGGFFIGPRDEHFSVGGTSTNVPIIVRRAMFNGMAVNEIVAGSLGLGGNVSVLRKSALWGYDTNLKWNLMNNDCHYMNLITGFRGLGLDESLSISEDLTQFDNPTGATRFPVGTRFLVNDKFSASNRFYGGQLGLAGEFRFGDWSLGYNGKVALGTTNQTVQINGGTTTTTTAGAVNSASGGFLALDTNIGRYTRKTFGVVPEIGFTLGYNITDWWRVTAGYNFLYWNNVVRPGEQVNTTVNPNFIPGGNRTGAREPSFRFNGNDYYTHGITLGSEIRF